MNLYIKNMVCPRCISAVRHLLEKLNIGIAHIQLGQVVTINKLTDTDLATLKDGLADLGFELLDNSQKQVVEQIKNLIIALVVYQSESNEIVLSEYLSSHLNKDYSSLSKLFSSTEGITIEQYSILQKVERIKELLSYEELTLSEIAFRMGYSSVAHISSQFKKVTGMTPSQFKSQKNDSRKSIDNI